MNKKLKMNIVVLITTVIGASLMFILLKNNKFTSINENKVVIKSNELKLLLENSWANVDFGDKESTFDNYDIYFDEGIEVRNIDQRVYNIVFTEKYKKNIINNLRPNSKLDEVIEELGQQDFGGTSINLIGYEIEDYYIFFNGSQASIYSNKKYEHSDYDIFKTHFETEDDFINSIINNLEDYDMLSVEKENEEIDYCLIDYANRGIRISKVNNKLNIYAYNNCELTLPKNDIYEIITKNKNLIYEVETERQNSIHNRKFAYDEYQYSLNNIPPDLEEIDVVEQEFEIIQSRKFIDFDISYKETGEYQLLFVSIDGKFPNSEIDSYVTSNIWLDDDRTVYGVKDKGIYLYNVKTRENTILKEGIGDFIIQGLTKDGIVKYDNGEIKVNI